MKTNSISTLPYVNISDNNLSKLNLEPYGTPGNNGGTFIQYWLLNSDSSLSYIYAWKYDSGVTTYDYNGEFDDSGELLLTAGKWVRIIQDF